MLVLCDGTVIEPVGAPPQGTRHIVRYGRERASGAEVVIKVELIEGALAREAVALRWLAGVPNAPAPRLRADTRVRPAGDHRTRRCLVLDRAPGAPPETIGGWARLGTALAALADVPWEDSGLPVCGAARLRREHEGRVADLAAAHPAAIERVRGRVATASSAGGADTTDGPDTTDGGDSADRADAVDMADAVEPLCLTHGDPGPGNFLDATDRPGALIDWEEAHIAPRGLDLGRATFIALLGAGPGGYVTRDRERRARAVAAAYLARARWAPSAGELWWWLIVAGVQFAHRRHERAGEPGVLPAREALDVLVHALARPELLDGLAR
jgi:aminoglycoside phosphotransferase (APT) family kinase protein